MHNRRDQCFVHIASGYLPSRFIVEVSALVLTIVVAAIPFLSQPFHMDDNFYMDMARNVLQDPLYPYQNTYVFEGKVIPDMGSHSHPPFQAYFLACILYLFGEGPGKEWVYHACALIFPVIAGISFYFLAARFLKKPIRPALLLICSPVFLVMQHNLMTDIPNLAFWLAAIAAFIRANETDSKAAYFTSSLFQLAAMFTNYLSLSLTLLLGFYHFRKRNSVVGWIALLSPVAIIGTWFALNCLHYGRFLLAETIRYVETRNSWSPGSLTTKFEAIVQYQGWLIVFPVSLLFAFVRGLARRILMVAALIAAYWTWYALPQYSLLNKGILVIGFVAGLAVLFQMAGQISRVGANASGLPEWKPADRQFVWLWYFGVSASCLFVFSDGSARYILPLVPPVLILFCRKIEVWSQTKEKVLCGTLVFCAAVLLSGASGIALSNADLEFAEIYPRAARDAKRMVGRMASYYGGEWGFRYYMRRAGFKQLPGGGSQLPDNGWLIRPRLALPYELDSASLNMTVPVKEIAYRVRTPLRLLDRWSPAGFYSTHWGKLPFSFSWRGQEVIEIRQINYVARNMTAADIVSPPGEKPKLGRLSIAGRTLAAILMRPGTRITFPATELSTLGLEVKCAVSPDAWKAGDDCAFEFVIARYNEGGDLLDSVSESLQPGLRESDRNWRVLRLERIQQPEGLGYLEVAYSSSCKDEMGLGGFAEPLFFDNGVGLADR